MNTEFSFTEQGDLRIALTAQGRQFIEERLSMASPWSDTDIFLELIDSQLVDGWYVVPAQQVRTRSSSILLTRDVRYDEQGSVVFVGVVYWYPQTERESYIQALQSKGSVLFKKGYRGDAIELKTITG